MNINAPVPALPPQRSVKSECEKLAGEKNTDSLALRDGSPSVAVVGAREKHGARLHRAVVPAVLGLQGVSRFAGAHRN